MMSTLIALILGIIIGESKVDSDIKKGSISHPDPPLPPRFNPELEVGD